MTFTSSSILKKLFVLFFFFAGLYFAKYFLIPIAIGTVLATLFHPLCKWMEAKKMPRFLAASICLVLFLSGIAAIASLISWQIVSITNDAALIKEKALVAIEQVQQYIFNHSGISKEEQAQLVKDQQVSVTGFIEIFLGSMLQIFTGFILTLVYVFLLLYYRTHIKEFLLKLSEASHREETEKLIYRTANVSQQYLVGLSKMIFCLWIMYGIGFSILGVKNAFFFAILCGLLEIIPFLGNLTGTLITVLVTAANGAGIPMILGIVFTYGIVQFVQGWVLEPLIVGPQVKINPLFTIVALILGELIWGIPGVFLAIPLSAMFKIICDHIEPLKPYGFLIGEIKTTKSNLGLVSKIKHWFR